GSRPGPGPARARRARRRPGGIPPPRRCRPCSGAAGRPRSAGRPDTTARRGATSRSARPRARPDRRHGIAGRGPAGPSAARPRRSRWSRPRAARGGAWMDPVDAPPRTAPGAWTSLTPTGCYAPAPGPAPAPEVGSPAHVSSTVRRLSGSQVSRGIETRGTSQVDSGTDKLLVAVESGMARVTFNNPAKHNALSVYMLAALPPVLSA